MPNPIETLRRLLQPLHDRISSGIARGVVHMVKNSTQLQELQIEILKGELRDGVEYFTPYGLETVPDPDGSEHLVVFAQNHRDHPIVVSVVNRQHRPTDGVTGEVGLYDDQGQRVKIYRDRVEIESATKVVVAAPLLEVEGDVTATGSVTATGDVESTGGDVIDPNTTLDALRTAYNSHTHAETGGTTGPPTPTA